MKVSFSLGSIIGTLLLCVMAPSAQAATICTVIGSGPLDLTMALQGGTINVPRDMPVGSRIYLQTLTPAAPGVMYECNRKDTPDVIPSYIVDQLPGLDVKNFGGPSQYAGMIYDTNIKGIGVAWFAAQSDVKGVGKTEIKGPKIDDVGASGCSADKAPAGSCRTGALRLIAPTMSLFKTGPVADGAVIDGASLGRLSFRIRVADSDVLRLVSVNLSGQIKLVSSTCNTGDVNVDMGKQKISTLTGKGSAMPVVKFVVTLTNCPAFVGFNSNSGVDSPTSSENGVISPGTRKANTLMIQVDPVRSPIDAATGVLSLETGAGMATGVGVQLLDENGNPRALSTPVLVSQALVDPIKITFGARYLQTATTVTAGKANAVATYTITYF